MTEETHEWEPIESGLPSVVKRSQCQRCGLIRRILLIANPETKASWKWFEYTPVPYSPNCTEIVMRKVLSG